MKGRGIKKVIMHPHPSPLPSRERGNWIESISFFGYKLDLDAKGYLCEKINTSTSSPYQGEQFQT
jgi:hypothetical protein